MFWKMTSAVCLISSILLAACGDSSTPIPAPATVVVAAVATPTLAPSPTLNPPTATAAKPTNSPKPTETTLPHPFQHPDLGAGLTQAYTAPEVELCCVYQ